MNHDHRCRHPSFHYPSPVPTVNGALARIGAWCADHVLLVSVVVLGTAFLAGMMTGATL